MNISAEPANFHTCAFTGHRPQKLKYGFNESHPACFALKSCIEREMIKMMRNHNVFHFLSGMALGVDTWAAEIVLSIKAHDPRVTLECAVPCETQDSKWPFASRRRYRHILNAADKVTVLQKEYTPGCMFKRDMYMVDQADYLICVYNGDEHSGTGRTLQYAESRGIIPVIIDASAF